MDLDPLPPGGHVKNTCVIRLGTLPGAMILGPIEYKEWLIGLG